MQNEAKRRTAGYASNIRRKLREETSKSCFLKSAKGHCPWEFSRAKFFNGRDQNTEGPVPTAFG